MLLKWLRKRRRATERVHSGLWHWGSNRIEDSYIGPAGLQSLKVDKVPMAEQKILIRQQILQGTRMRHVLSDKEVYQYFKNGSQKTQIKSSHWLNDAWYDSTTYKCQ